MEVKQQSKKEQQSFCLFFSQLLNINVSYKRKLAVIWNDTISTFLYYTHRVKSTKQEKHRQAVSLSIHQQIMWVWFLSLAAERGTRREAKRRWSETVWRSDSQQLSSGKLKNESRDTDSIWQNKDRDRRVERQKWRGQREEETLGIVGLKPERGRGGLKQHSEKNDWV